MTTGDTNPSQHQKQMTFTEQESPKSVFMMSTDDTKPTQQHQQLTFHVEPRHTQTTDDHKMTFHVEPRHTQTTDDHKMTFHVEPRHTQTTDDHKMTFHVEPRRTQTTDDNKVTFHVEPRRIQTTKDNKVTFHVEPRRIQTTDDNKVTLHMEPRRTQKMSTTDGTNSKRFNAEDSSKDNMQTVTLDNVEIQQYEVQVKVEQPARVIHLKSSEQQSQRFMEKRITVKYMLAFEDPSVRAKFVSTVMFIVAFMLTIVTLMSAFPFMHPPMRTYVQKENWIYWVSLCVFMVIIIVLSCCGSAFRSYPANFILLTIVTLSIGFMTMFITAFHNVETVFLCFALTVLTCIGVGLFVSITKKDLTSMMGVCCLAALCLCLFGLALIIGLACTKIRWYIIVFAGLGYVLSVIWLAIDIQLIMGGKMYEIDTDEYVFASVILFLDTIRIFYYLLLGFGGGGGNR